MTVTAATLRDLHRIHQQLTDLRDRLQRGPRQIQIRETTVAKLQAKLEELHESSRKMQMTIDRKQLELKSGEQKIVDVQGKLNASSSNKEFQAFQEQIAAAEMAGSVLADEILEGMEKIDQLKESEQQAKEQVQAGEQDLAQTTHEVEGSAALIQADVTRLEKDLSQEEATLPAEIKADYKRIVGRKGADGMAASAGGVCNGCGQNITLNMQSDLLLSKIVFCNACGCMLYQEPA